MGNDKTEENMEIDIFFMVYYDNVCNTYLLPWKKWTIMTYNNALINTSIFYSSVLV